ncbi:MAG: NAD-dependent epimerase/dehydratase family protein [Bacteroidota bacterium]
MNILVTGGAGFIASHIVDAYVNLGHAVTIIDDLTTGKRVNVNPAARFVQGDIRDAVAVEKLFHEGKFDVINHHAAQMDVRRSVADPVFDASVNVVGVLTLLEVAVRTGVKRVIFASSGGAIYGEQEYFPADEQHPTRPISPYGVAKLTTEQYLFYYKAVYGIEWVALRYANVYGPRQNPEGEAGVIAIFTTKMLKGDQPVINGDGRQTRDYVYVGDVVQANVAALSYPGSTVFNVGTGIETDVNVLFQELRRITGSHCEERHGEAKKGEQLRSVLDTKKIKKELNWSPQVRLSEGFQLTVDFFRRQSAHGA